MAQVDPVSLSTGVSLKPGTELKKEKPSATEVGMH